MAYASVPGLELGRAPQKIPCAAPESAALGFAFVTTGIILILVLMRSAVRRTWLADALFVILLTPLSLGTSASVAPGPGGSPRQIHRPQLGPQRLPHS